MLGSALCTVVYCVLLCIVYSCVLCTVVYCVLLCTVYCCVLCTVQVFVPHPSYQADKILNDVALVQLPANALPAYTGNNRVSFHLPKDPLKPLNSLHF